MPLISSSFHGAGRVVLPGRRRELERMRKLRKTGALLALLATAWSSSPVLPCGSPSSADTGAPTRAARAGGDHDHTGHGAHHAGSGHRSEDRGADAKGGDAQACGVLMACGAGLRAAATVVMQAVVPAGLDDAPFASVEQPSAVDLTQDTPPPRRNA
jgi:hypothetical protein